MEKMYISGNMDKSLIRKNPITAISMEKDDLFMLLKDGLSPFVADEMYERNEPIDPDELLDIALCEQHGAFPFDQLYQDIQAAVKVDPLDVRIDDTDTCRNGIPAIQINLRGEEGAEIAVLVYWDGKTFRGYVPMYGNNINPLLNCVYGLEGDADPDLYLGKTYAMQAWGPYTPHFKESEEFLPQDKTVQITLTKDNYPAVEWLRFRPNAEACADDFYANVTSGGHLSREEAWELSATVAIEKN